MIGNIPYCPTLYTRVAEIKALAQLPASTKDNLFPLLLARPWPNATHAEATWEKIGEALGKRRFAIDLDRSQSASGVNRPAAATFQSFASSKSGFKNYYDAVQGIPFATPVLRMPGGSVELFEYQADNIDRIDRGIVVRIEFGISRDPFHVIDTSLQRFRDVTFFVDTGWSRDLLNRELWASRIVEHISRSQPEIEIVISGSSFPDSFVNFGKRRATHVDERSLHRNLSRRHNAANLVYGDWGSTRPPLTQTPMKNIPRIDLPMRSEWISFRRDQSLAFEESYTDIAKRVVDDPDWPVGLDIWGTYAINWTSSGEPGAIRGSASAAAARINIHLHRQAFFNENDTVLDGDEPFTDD